MIDRLRYIPMRTNTCVTVVAVLLTVVVPAECASQCASPNFLSFCKAVDWHVPAVTNGFAQDSRAKALYDTVLNTMVMSKGVVLTTRCLVAFR